MSNKKKIGRPKSADKAEPVSIYVNRSVLKFHKGKDKYRSKLKQLSEEHLENINDEQTKLLTNTTEQNGTEQQSNSSDESAA